MLPCGTITRLIRAESHQRQAHAIVDRLTQYGRRLQTD